MILESIKSRPYAGLSIHCLHHEMFGSTLYINITSFVPLEDEEIETHSSARKDKPMPTSSTRALWIKTQSRQNAESCCQHTLISPTLKVYNHRRLKRTLRENFCPSYCSQLDLFKCPNFYHRILWRVKLSRLSRLSRFWLLAEYRHMLNSGRAAGYGSQEYALRPWHPSHRIKRSWQNCLLPGSNSQLRVLFPPFSQWLYPNLIYRKKLQKVNSAP